ncbi:hypothetical protein Clacol_007511 [Clathrus columnatus]|uniref:F-box domain-containing protein n=1 Tax=Clathrus columnatus TaxID=1419009 RepID=A0AAV5AG09_9AGAM|nr:hypothetical protein Clacol_007511 [Clathrus columnatus]
MYSQVTPPLSLCVVSVLPTELWLHILEYLSVRELSRIIRVSRFFHNLALPLCYSDLTIPIPKPSSSTIFEVISRYPFLQNAIKSIELSGGIDTVVLCRRTLTRTSALLETSAIRNRFISCLPLLTSLQALHLITITLIPNLCHALIDLPQLERLVLEDCRGPIPSINVFADHPTKNRLKHVELKILSWKPLSSDLDILAPFFYSSDLQVLVTNQPHLLDLILARDLPSKPFHLSLYDVGENDLPPILRLFGHPKCSLLKGLTIKKRSDIYNGLNTKPTFQKPRLLEFFDGDAQLATLFIDQHSKIRELRLSEFCNLRLDLFRLVGKSYMTKLVLTLKDASIINYKLWDSLEESFCNLTILKLLVSKQLPGSTLTVGHITLTSFELLPCTDANLIRVGI